MWTILRLTPRSRGWLQQVPVAGGFRCLPTERSEVTRVDGSLGVWCPLALFEQLVEEVVDEIIDEVVEGCLDRRRLVVVVSRPPQSGDESEFAVNGVAVAHQQAPSLAKVIPRARSVTSPKVTDRARSATMRPP